MEKERKKEKEKKKEKQSERHGLPAFSVPHCAAGLGQRS
jgi:hypothetical protein